MLQKFSSQTLRAALATLVGTANEMSSRVVSLPGYRAISSSLVWTVLVVALDEATSIALFFARIICAFNSYCWTVAVIAGLFGSWIGKYQRISTSCDPCSVFNVVCCSVPIPAFLRIERKSDALAFDQLKRVLAATDLI